MTLASARLKASVRFPSLKGMYQRGSTCKGCDRLAEADQTQMMVIDPVNTKEAEDRIQEL